MINQRIENVIKPLHLTSALYRLFKEFPWCGPFHSELADLVYSGIHNDEAPYNLRERISGLLEKASFDDYDISLLKGSLETLDGIIVNRNKFNRLSPESIEEEEGFECGVKAIIKAYNRIIETQKKYIN